MKNMIEKNAARIIITTLIALVIVGIVTGVGVPYNVDNYDPGHSILEIGDPNYYFVEGQFTNGSTYLALELPRNIDEGGNNSGQFEIRPGTHLVIRESDGGGLGDPALVLNSGSTAANIGFYPGLPETGIPFQLRIWEDKVEIRSGNQLCVGGTGTAQCISDFSEITPSTGKEPDMVFTVGNLNTTERLCVQKNLEAHCGDEDGCRITLLMQNQASSDRVRVIDEHIYMEQTSASNNTNPGIYGYTRQEGGGERFWQTGIGNSARETMFNPWDWAWMFDYIHDSCPGQIGNSSTFNDPYEFVFMSESTITTKFIVQD